MDINQLKIMLELQALQNFNTPTGSTNNNALFQEMFNTMLAGFSGLGSVNNFTEQNNPMMQSVGRQIPLTLQPGSPLPTYVQQMQQQDTSTSKIGKTGFDKIIEQSAQAFQLPVKLIKSIIKHESNFNPNAVSHAGASGLMQLMPRTAAGLGVKDVFDPADNVKGGSKYIRQMLDRYNGDMRLALAAYNAGPGNVDKYNGIPPFKETQNYVSKVMNSFNA